MNKFTFTTSRWLMLVLFVLLGQIVQAQVANYTFSQSSGTYTPISGGTVLGVPNNDDTSFGPFAIGFNFTYNGVAYNQFGVNSNGFISMGAAPTSSYTSISTGTTNNIVAAVNYDTQGDATTGDLQYAVIGTAPNRTLVIQWTNYDSYQSAVNGDSWTYQIRLAETTNEVSVVYGTFVSDATANTPQVGLRGNSNTDFNNRTTTTDWNLSAAGATNAANMTLSATVLPVSGLTFTWAPPPPPPAPTNLTFTSVTTNSMVLNWVDNSTNETGFQIYRSLDGISYSFVGTVASTTAAATGGNYTFNQIGLSSNTLYYYQVYAYNPTLSAPPASGSQLTLPGTLCGTSSIGPTGTYPSITAAVTAAQANGVACPVIWELQAAYVSTVEPAFPVVIPALGLSATNNITLRPELGATNLSVTSGSVTQTLKFDGCNYFTIDGRAGGVGTTRDLTLENTSLTGITVQYVNDASFNALRYLLVKGVTNLASQGVITYGSSAANGLGSVGNVVSDCDVLDGLTTPANLIYSANTTANAFNSTTVNNCNLYNFFSATVVSTAIRTDAGNTAWTITNNNMFQTATRTYTTANIHDGILINTATGRGYTITGNFIGGTTPACGGTAMTMTGTIATRFFGISLNVASGGTTSLVQNNTIGNINLTTTSGSTVGVVLGISVAGTGGNITINGNTVGSTTANNNIVATVSTTGGSLLGITNSASGNIAITNNNIGGFAIAGSTAAISTTCLGITTSGGNNTITGNTIGSTTVVDNMLTAASTGTTAGLITAIQCSSALVNNISNNTIQNLTNRYSGTSTGGLTRGILVSSGINTINANTIRNISNLTPETGTGLTTSVIGIVNSATTAGVQTVSNNVIENVTNNGTTGNISVAGIVMSPGTANAHLVFNNKIKGVGAPLNLGTAIINGIAAIGGTSTYYNNMIVLGLDATGVAYTPAQEYNGILKSATTNNNFYFNTVSIAGTGVAAGTANTYAFRRTATAVDIAKNNIFINTRSNAAAGAATHNSYGLNLTTTFTSDNNDIWGNGTGWQAGVVATTPYGSLSLWKAGTSLDNVSTTVDANFVSATDLHINNSITSPLESKGVVIAGISTDIDAQNRPGPTGSVNGGGTLPDLGADEFDGIPVSLDMGAAALASPLATGCKTATETVTVTIQNFSTQAIDFALNPLTVSCSVAGPNPQSFTNVVLNTGNLAGGAQQAVTFSTSYDMTAVGTYVFTASAVVTGDGASSNDAMPPVTINNTPGTASGTTNSVCAYAPTDVTVTGYTPGGTIQWQASANGTTGWTNVASATTAVSTVIPTDTTYYRALICGNPSNVIVINAQFVTAPIASAVTRCGPGAVTLTASSNATMSWYAAASGGTALATGGTYTPTVTNSTTYYVAAAGSGAQNTPVPGGNTWNQYTTAGSFQTTTITGASMVFDALQNLTLSTIDMYPSAAIGTSFTIEVRQSSGTGALIGTYTGVTTVQNTGTPTVAQTVPVNFTIPAGTNYVIGFAVNPNTWRGNVTNFPYPYTLPGYFNIQGSSFGTSPGTTLIYQYYLYNFVVSTGCESQRIAVPVTVTAPPAMTAAAGSPVVCNGLSTTLTASSSNPDYVYTWAPSATLSSATGASVTATPLVGTTYSVTASDANTGCQTNTNVSVGVNPLPNVSATATPSAVCPGATVALNGAAVNNFAVGTGTVQNTTTTYPAPYGNWYWGAKHQMLIRASELLAAGIGAGNINGIQFDIVTTNGVALNSFEIQMAPTALTALTTTFVSTGFTVVSPAATYTPTVGVNTHNFTTPFNWDGISNIVIQTCFNNASFTNNAVFNQTATSYASTIWYNADAATVCPTTTGTTINQRPNMTFITTPSYAYAWTPAATVANATAATTTATPTATTPYVFAVTNNATGCVASATANVTVFPLPTVTATSTNVLCNGAANGTATATAASGTASYTYAWSNGGTTASITGLSGGTYTVSVTDANNCVTATASVTVAEPAAPLTLDAAILTPVACFGGSNGAIDIAISGGTAPYTYAWSTGATTQDVSGLVAASYSGTITDANGCTLIVGPAIVTEPAVLALTAAVTNVTCNGAANGAIDITVTGGTTPYNYAWSNGAVSEDISGLAPGVYSGTITDANGCTVVGGPVTITEPTVLTIDSAVVSNVTCFGATNGSIDITVSGGTAPYTYAWSDGSTTEDLANLVPGTYTGTITDANGCTVVGGPITITEPAVLVATADAVENVSCNGSNDGRIVVSVSGGTQPYGFVWSDGSTTQNISGLAPGTYDLTVTDANGCTAVLIGTIITEPTAIVITAAVTNVSCNAGTNGAVDLTVTGGVPAYTYAWSNSATSEDLTGLVAGPYDVTVTDATGCSVTLSNTVAQPAIALQLGGLPTITNVTCNGLCNGGLSNVVIVGGTTPYTYSWVGPNGFNANTANLSNLCAGTYNGTVTDANGCTYTPPVALSITQPDALVVTLTPTAASSSVGATDGSVANLVSGGVPAYTYSWSNAVTTANLTGVAAGTYSVTVTDTNGCIASAITTVGPPTGVVNVEGVNNFNMFPNPTGGNVTITFDLATAQNVELSLFNVNGQLVKYAESGAQSNIMFNLDLSSFTGGVYMARFTVGGETFTKQIVLVK